MACTTTFGKVGDYLKKTEEGYEAVLDFETVRHDGRNVEVKYDGSYHIRLV